MADNLSILRIATAGKWMFLDSDPPLRVGMGYPKLPSGGVVARQPFDTWKAALRVKSTPLPRHEVCFFR